jgi:LmbE family N-acetylglucosaminyl deacetylase
VDIGVTREPLRILTVLAHPDDESFGPAAMLAMHAQAGAIVHGLFFTRGQHGQTSLQPAPTPDELGALREQDLRDATATIGFAGIEVLDFEDGTLAELPPEVLEALVQDAIERCRPHVVITFGPAGITRHPDHLAVHAATVDAFHQALAAGLELRELYYDALPPEIGKAMGLTDEPDANPNTFIEVTDFQHVKLDALRCHARHIVDAQLWLDRLEGQPQTTFTMFRAWPLVPKDGRITELVADTTQSRTD